MERKNKTTAITLAGKFSSMLKKTGDANYESIKMNGGKQTKEPQYQSISPSPKTPKKLTSKKSADGHYESLRGSDAAKKPAKTSKKAPMALPKASSTLTLPPEVMDSANMVPKKGKQSKHAMEKKFVKTSNGTKNKPTIGTNRQPTVDVIQSSHREATQYERKVLGKKEIGSSTPQKSVASKGAESPTISTRKNSSKSEKDVRESSQIQRNYREMVRAVVESQYQKSSIWPRLIVILFSWFLIFTCVIVYLFVGTSFMDPTLNGFNNMKFDDGFCFVEVNLYKNLEDCGCGN